MKHTQEQLVQIKHEFSRRKRNQFIAAAPLIVAMVAFMVFRDKVNDLFVGVPTPIFSGILIAVVGAILLYSWRNWRCPGCDEYLGRSTSMVHCPSCGVALK